MFGGGSSRMAAPSFSVSWRSQAQQHPLEAKLHATHAGLPQNTFSTDKAITRSTQQ